MAPESRHESASVSERLLREPYRFDFFQAVRLLERLEAEQGRSCYPVGHDRLPAQEAVRLPALPGLSFPAGEISQIRPRNTQGNDNLPPEMIVTFMGLTGPAGVLPQHYTTLLLQRLRSRDTTLRDFLDLFNHRMLSLFYRAWEKYRFPLAYERSRLDKGGTINQETPADSDLFGQGLYALVGLGLPALRVQVAPGSEAFLYFAGLFAHQPRPAVCLENLLSEHFGVPVQVRQFEGQWLYLEEDDRTRLGAGGSPEGCNTQLGADAVAGQRAWEVQSKLRLRMGPLTWAQFRDLLPTGASRPMLLHLARTYLGPDLDFDVQLVLLPLEVPWCQITSDEDGFQLGLNSWVRSHDFDTTVDDVVLDDRDRRTSLQP